MIDDYYQVVTVPAEEPVTLTEAKDWCRITTTADDTLVTALISSARIFGEKYCNRIFITTGIDCYFNGLDYSNSETYGFIQLRRSPLISITAVSIYSGGSYTATTDYILRESSSFSRLIFQNGLEHDADTDQPFILKVEATFGYGSAADVPEEIKTALKQHIAFLYENRGDVVAEGKLPMPLETKLIYSRNYRIINTF